MVAGLRQDDELVAHAPMGSELPHGGFGSSGYGKDLGLYALDDYTRIKHVAHAL